MIISKQEAISRNLNKYFTGKPCKRGHTSERYTSNSDCVECSIDRAMGVHSGTPIEEVYRKTRERRTKNIDKYLESEKNYRKKNAEKTREHARRYYWNNRDKSLNNSRKWFLQNKEKAQEYWRIKSSKNRSTVEGRLVTGLRSRISAMVKSGAESQSASEYLGCTIDEFRIHLESKFQDGMAWDNYGLSGWHIDHIKPLSVFDLTRDEDVREAFHFSNTQPMWALENIEKSNSWQV